MALFPGHHTSDHDAPQKDHQFPLSTLSLNDHMHNSSSVISSYDNNDHDHDNDNDINAATTTSHGGNTRSRHMWRKFKQRLPYYIPIMSWLPKYQRSYLPGDLAAGLSLAVVMVPQSIAYSSLVHVPANMGLYTAFYPTIIYAFLGSSPHLSVGPETATAIIIGSMAASLATSTGPDGHPLEDDVVRLITQFTFVCGILKLIMGVLRLGFIDSILSAPVLAGFIQAEAFILIVEQAPRLIGIKPCPPSSCEDSGGYIPKAIWFFEHMSNVHWQTVIISVICIATLGIFGYCKARWPHIRRLVIFPHVALVVAVATIISWSLDLQNDGVDVIGKVSAGLMAPSMHVPSAKDLSTMLPLSVTVLVIGFVASQVASKRMSTKYGYTQSANRDLVAFGMASLVGSCFGSWPGYGSLMRTKVSDAAGCRTAMAGLFSALFVLLVIVFVTPAFYHMPKAVTASIIFSVACSLLDLAELRFIVKCRQWRDAALLMSMTIITFCFGISTGIFFAFGACLLLVVRLTTSPGVTMLGRSNDHDEFADLADVTIGAQSIEGLLIFKIEGPLHFANSAKLRESTRRVEYYGALHVHPSEKLAPVELACAIFDMTSLTQVDSTAASVLLDIVRHYHERDVRVCFVHLRVEIQQLFNRAGIRTELETYHHQPYFDHLRDAVVALQAHIQERARTHSNSQSRNAGSGGSGTASTMNSNHDNGNGNMIASSSSMNHDPTNHGVTPSVSFASVTDHTTVDPSSSHNNGVDRTPLLSQHDGVATSSHGSPRGHHHERKSSISIIVSGSPDHVRRRSTVTGAPLTPPPSNSGGMVRLKSSSMISSSHTRTSGMMQHSLHDHDHDHDDDDDAVFDRDRAYLTQSPLVLLQALGREPSSSSSSATATTPVTASAAPTSTAVDAPPNAAVTPATVPVTSSVNQ